MQLSWIHLVDFAFIAIRKATMRVNVQPRKLEVARAKTRFSGSVSTFCLPHQKNDWIDRLTWLELGKISTQLQEDNHLIFYRNRSSAHQIAVHSIQRTSELVWNNELKVRTSTTTLSQFLLNPKQSVWCTVSCCMQLFFIYHLSGAR